MRVTQIISIIGFALISTLATVSPAAVTYGRQDFLVPVHEFVSFDPNPFELHHRIVRQVYGGINGGNPGGVQGTVGTGGTLYDKNGHSVDGHAEVSRNWHPNGPTNVNGGLDYQGPRGGASLNANHVRHYGTDVTATGNANIWKSRDGKSTLDGEARYNRHFGGPGGSSRPNYGAGINFNHKF